MSLLRFVVAICAASLAVLPVAPGMADTSTNEGGSLTFPETLRVSADECRRPEIRLRVTVPRGGSVILLSTRARHLKSDDLLYDGPYLGFSDADKDGVIRWRDRIKICTTWPRGRYALTIHLDLSGPRDPYRVRNTFSVLRSE